ncbi:MAG: uracil-DNA glycosylase family protein [Jiangellaceae bacterium]
MSESSRGDQEDRSGRPFVGPAGRILDSALEDAGIARSQIYVTNVVKHVKFRRAEGGNVGSINLRARPRFARANLGLRPSCTCSTPTCSCAWERLPARRCSDRPSK